MRSLLSKKQVEMLLDGKALTYGRVKLVLPSDFEGRKSLEMYVTSPQMRDMYDIYYDTKTSGLSIVNKRENAKEK